MIRPTSTRIAMAAIFSLAAAALTGCNASANLTVGANSLAAEVATVLQQQVDADIPPNIDCGTEPINLVVNETVVCELTTDGSDDIYDTTVTITEVDGTEYAFDVSVAAEPR